jgi:hypothetical protein
VSKMLAKSATKSKVCTCYKHHKPTIPWKSRARHQARAREKQQVQREIREYV